jgi:single-stranded-DNA-specific exonuclease
MAQTDPKESIKWLTYLTSLNDVRKNRQLELMKEIENFYGSWIEHPFILIPGENFEKGILGPVAGRLSELYKKPTIVLSKNKDGTLYSGSGRSTGSIDLLGLIKDNPYADKNKTGGHKAACGVTFPVERLNDFWKHAQEMTMNLDPNLYQDESKDCFGEIDLNDIDFELFSKIESFQPFGQKFQKPTFQAKVKFTKLMKISKNKNHYSCEVQDEKGITFRAMYFFFTEELSKKKKYKIEFTINRDTFKTDDPEKLVLFIRKAGEIND